MDTDAFNLTLSTIYVDEEWMLCMENTAYLLQYLHLMKHTKGYYYIMFHSNSIFNLSQDNKSSLTESFHQLLLALSVCHPGDVRGRA